MLSFMNRKTKERVRGVSLYILYITHTGMIQARREWQKIFKVLKEKNFQPTILYLTKL